MSAANFEGFLNTLNKRRDARQDTSADTRALAIAARHLMDLLREQPIDQDRLIARLRSEFGADETQLRDLIAKLLEHDFLARQPDGKLALTPFAEKALNYFRLAV
jgi:hypothetical protein